MKRKGVHISRPQTNGVRSGDEFVIFDGDDRLPTGAVPFVVIESTKSLGRAELFFHCDRPKSSSRRVRRVAALVSSAES